jgi:hypothetical protein
MVADPGFETAVPERCTKASVATAARERRAARRLRFAAVLGGAALGLAAADAAMKLHARRIGRANGDSGGTSGPSWGKLLREGPAAIRMLASQLGRVPVQDPTLGRGRAVLVVPGFLADDMPTSLLRRTLRASGFQAYGWGQGPNLGARPDTLTKLSARLDEIIADVGGPVALIGWSLGGLYVRELGKQRAADVSVVITLGTPFSVDLRANNAWKLYELINDHTVDDPPVRVAPKVKPPMTTVAIWSQEDGIVAPASARGTHEEVDRQVRVTCPHSQLASHPEAIAAILEVFRTMDRAREE